MGIVQKIEQICGNANYHLLYCCIIGSTVYFDGSDLVPSDTDVLCVVDGCFDTQGTIDYSLDWQGGQFDLQIIHRDKYQELLTKNHMFYVESWLVPSRFVLCKRFNFELKLRQDFLLMSLQANIQKTRRRAENSFMTDNFRKGKKQILHIVRIGLFAQMLLRGENIDFGCSNHLFELVDDSPMTMVQWIQLLNDLYPNTI